MRPVKRLLSVHLQTPAFDQSIDYYTRGFGLGVALSADNATASFTAAASSTPVLKVSRASQAKLSGIEFAVASAADLHAAATKLRAAGYDPLEATTSDASLTVVDPDGRLVILQVDPTEVGTEDIGGQPLILSHVVLNSPDVKRLTSFFVDGLGFAIADMYEKDLLTFLRCDQPQHHCIGVSPGQVGSLNHFSIDVGSIDGVMKGVGRMQTLRLQPIWGPGRHGPGGNIFCYFEDPSGFVAEFTCDVVQIEDEANWIAKEWPRNAETGNVWGTGGPSPRAIELMSGPPR